MTPHVVHIGMFLLMTLLAYITIKTGVELPDNRGDVVGLGVTLIGLGVCLWFNTQVWIAIGVLGVGGLMTGVLHSRRVGHG